MDNELKAKIRASLNKCNNAVVGMTSIDCTKEEAEAWTKIYNINMDRIMEEYLIEEPPFVEPPFVEPPTDVEPDVPENEAI